MIKNYSVRTDLALEEKERFESDHVEVSGVVLEEEYDEEREMMKHQNFVLQEWRSKQKTEQRQWENL